MENLTLNQLGQLVYDYCGLNYLSNLSSLEMKTQRRLKELHINSLRNYIRYLEENPIEWDHLIEVLTINETYFYREDKQLSIYKEVILPQLMESSSDKPVQIWSAACSTGEEPYSLAIMTAESSKYTSYDVNIVGTDINKKVLGIARKASYSKRSLSFRRIPERWLQEYFDETPLCYEVKESIKEMVNFNYLNLLDSTKNNKYEEYDVIFCRNVLIYFDEETVKKVVTAFYHALKKGGYLFLGHAETISKINIGFETINSNGTFYYRKG